MKRKTSTIPSRIYTVGLLPPDSENLRQVEEQLFLAHRFQNQLVEIERRRREGYRDLLRGADPEVSVLEEKVSQLNDQLQTAWTLQNAKDVSKTEKKSLDEKVKKLRSERSDTLDALDSAKLRAQDTPNFDDQAKDLNTASYLEAKVTYNATTALYWGTKLLISKAMEQVRKKSGEDPRFKRWRGEGRVGVQFQGGQHVDRLFSLSNTLLQIGRVDPAVWGQWRRQHGDATAVGTRGERRRGSRTWCKLRINSTNTGKPVWAKFQAVLDRPFPPDAVVKWAWIKRRRVATHFRYELQLVLESETFRSKAPRPGLVAALNVNWRRRDSNDLRVCYLVDEDDTTHEIRMLSDVQQQLEHADSLRSLQDKIFNELKDQLRAGIDGVELPAWLIERLSGEEGRLSFSWWRSQAKMASVVLHWRNQRFAGDEQLFDLVESWRIKDKHLYEWECNDRDKAVRRRREHYRLRARELCQKYSVIHVPEVDNGKLKKKATAVEDKTDLPQAARNNFQHSAPASFLDQLKLMAPKFGTSLVKASAKLITVGCHNCGSLEKLDRLQLHHTCSCCGLRWDQDYNACRVVLSRANKPVPPPDQEVLAFAKSA